MATVESKEILKRYFGAWTTRNTKVTRELLADDFQFYFGEAPMGGRTEFLAASAYPSAARTDLLAEAYDGDTGFQMYASSNGDARVVVVEKLTVLKGKVAASSIVTDMAAFQAFMAGSRA